MTLAHTLGGVKTRADNRLSTLLRQALREAGHTQASLGIEINKHQTWVSQYLLLHPSKTIRRLFAEEPDTLDTILRALGLDRATILDLAGVTVPVPNAAEVALTREVLVFPAGAGPALDDSDAVEALRMPLSNGGSYKVIGLRIHGNSMSPYLDHGETAIIACEPGLVKPGSIIGIYIPEVGSVVKEFVMVMPSGEYKLKSMNPEDGGAYFTAPPDSRIYGPVIQRIKKG